jgi:hypothetical protein
MVQLKNNVEEMASRYLRKDCIQIEKRYTVILLTQLSLWTLNNLTFAIVNIDCS